MPGLKLRWLAECSSNNLTTVSWPLLAATLIAFRPQWSEWFGSAPWFNKARTQCSCPSWAAIPINYIVITDEPLFYVNQYSLLCYLIITINDIDSSFIQGVSEGFVIT